MPIVNGINDLLEARAYLQHPVLGKRLLDICKVLLQHKGKTARAIFRSPDDMKLRSSMTLFSRLHGADNCFQEVLDIFFEGSPDEKTIGLLKS